MDTNKNPESEDMKLEDTAQTDNVIEIEEETTSASKQAKARKKEDSKELQKLRQEKEELEQEVASTKDMYQRMLAEYANYKRRTEQEKEQLSTFVKAEMLKVLLPTLDNLERAVAAPAGEEYKTGVDMTIRQLSESLTAQGLESIDPQGQPFDPEIHHAVMREDAYGVEADTVTEVFQKGYRLGGRVLRPAMVKVAN